MAGIGCTFFEPRRHEVTEKNKNKILCLNGKRFVFNIYLTNYPFQLVCETSAASIVLSQFNFAPDIWGRNPIFAVSSRTYGANS
jgi:hypothetical protein